MGRPSTSLDPRALPTAHQRIWRAVRILRRDVSVMHLAHLASTTERATRQYMRLLERSGYCRIEKAGGHKLGNVHKYRLIRDTGPKAPRRALTVMVDANNGEIFALPAANRRAQALDDLCYQLHGSKIEAFAKELVA